MDRRRFIRQSALSAGGLILSAHIPFSRYPLKKPEVIVIGAGFAGLAAALQLKRKGVTVTVIESRSRIGGRVFSHPINENLVIELGGEWVGNSHVRVRELCAEFGLPLENNQMNTHLIYQGQYHAPGSWNYSEAWNAKFKKILDAYPHLKETDKQRLDQYDWWRFLVNNGCSGRDLEIRELLDSTDFGESIRHVSAFAALAEYAESSEKNEMDLKIKGGNALLVHKMREQIGAENIYCSHHVSRIVQKNRVEVTCTNGKRFTGDQLICAIPTFSVQQIHWDPVLPEPLTAAFNALQYARINKHALHFSERFWKEEAFDLVSDQSPHYFYHATKNQQSTEGVLIAYSIGDKAASNANQSNAFLADDVFRCLEPHFGNLRSLLKGQVNYYWGNDAYSYGAYALYGIGQWFKVMPELKKKFLLTHFAGEHLADWQGFMEGAMNTGEAAAAEVIG
ncbi:FAD-dependent oxidoreductase [Niabella sp. CC-SYL272]|uniref:flavin monoamine oxidase family protein n=1 Tax=Niabella agricola TaxID=2891571 RepID=UPI001F3EF58E|nr:NAD(P)/FAD-dependent oxidoreductase [Niabella agricola]MCF3110849.1 FAD-dependent oxidoreductase [Niabella agricola]